MVWICKFQTKSIDWSIDQSICPSFYLVGDELWFWWIIMNYDELWWIVMNYDEIMMTYDEIMMNYDELWWIMYPSKWDMTWLNWLAIPAINPDLHNSSRNHRKVATAAGENGPGCGMRYDLRDPWGMCVCVCWKPHDNLSKVGPKMAKILENDPKIPTTFKYSRKLSKNFQNNGWLMGWYQLTHGWHRQTPQIITYRIFFLTNKVTASESNQTFLEANTCQSYIPRIFWKLVRRQIFPQNQTIQKNSLIHGRILLYMGKNPPNKWDRRVPSGKRSHNYGKSPCY